MKKVPCFRLKTFGSVTAFDSSAVHVLKNTRALYLNSSQEDGMFTPLSLTHADREVSNIWTRSLFYFFL